MNLLYIWCTVTLVAWYFFDDKASVVAVSTFVGVIIMMLTMGEKDD